MELIDLLKKAKEKDVASFERIFDNYSGFITYEMDKYNIQDREACYTNVKTNLIKAIFLFKI